MLQRCRGEENMQSVGEPLAFHSLLCSSYSFLSPRTGPAVVRLAVFDIQPHVSVEHGLALGKIILNPLCIGCQWSLIMFCCGAVEFVPRRKRIDTHGFFPNSCSCITQSQPLAMCEVLIKKPQLKQLPQDCEYI